MLDRAKFLVVSEISEVIGDSSEVVDQKVNKALDRCLANRARAAARAKVAKVSKPIVRTTRRAARAS
jgi:hypothetical protein